MKRILFLGIIILALLFPLASVKAVDCCIYLDNSYTDPECYHISDDSPADCDEDANTIYPQNLVGGYRTDTSCFNFDAYTEHAIPDGPLCEHALRIGTEETGFVDILNETRGKYVKGKLGEYAQNMCCVPTGPLMKKDCHTPTIQKDVEERIRSGSFDASLLTPSPGSDGLTNLWSFMTCAEGVDAGDWRHYDKACSSYDVKTYCETVNEQYCLCDGKKTECYPSFFESKESCLERSRAEWYDWECVKIDKPIGACADLTQKDTPAEETPIKTMSIGTLKGMAAESLNPASLTSATQIIGRAIKLLTAFVGSIALALYIYSGLLWMTSAGNSGQVDKAKNILIWATLGVVIMLGSYVLVDFLFKSIG